MGKVAAPGITFILGAGWQLTGWESEPIGVGLMAFAAIWGLLLIESVRDFLRGFVPTAEEAKQMRAPPPAPVAPHHRPSAPSPASGRAEPARVRDSRRDEWLRPTFRLTPRTTAGRVQEAIEEGRVLCNEAQALQTATSILFDDETLAVAGLRTQADAWAERTLKSLANDVTPAFVRAFAQGSGTSVAASVSGDSTILFVKIDSQVRMLEELLG